MVTRFKYRLIIFASIFALLFAVLFVQLGNLTLNQGGAISSASESKTTRTQTIDGERGSILDTNGIPLAYDERSYDVEFLRDPSRTTYTDKAYYTDIIINTIKIIEDNDGKVIDTFNIVRRPGGEYEFDFGDVNEEAFQKRHENWCKNMYVNTESPAANVYRDLRNRYRIPESMSYEEARKVLSIWQEAQLTSYIAYEPVTIATNVDINTVADIEAHSDVLDGMQIAASTSRVYPYKSTAAHVIGYTGKITDDTNIEELENLGYTKDDLIGITGIESSMEEYLTGNTKDRQGTRTVEVSSSGKVVAETGSTPAQQGDSVMLTLDLGLQTAAEEALKKNIEEINRLQQEAYDEKRDDYDDILNGREPEFAKSGAAVVMEAKTGKTLAIANYPSYDINWFTGGISPEKYDELLNDPATPLFNKAISSTGIPGSTFKMVTAIAGLMEGVLTLDETISDEGYFDKYINDPDSGEHGPKCWVYPYYDQHKNLDLQEALQVSCNYYFYVVADRLGIEKLDSWAERLGLTNKTDIQIPGEVTGQVGGPLVLYDGTLPLNQQKTALPVIVYNSVHAYLEKIGESRNVEYSDEVLDETAKALIDLASNETTQNGGNIRQVLYEHMAIPTEVSFKVGYDNDINSYISELVWKPTDTAIVGIGSGITAVTPISVARYVSAIVNGGTVYDANIVDRIIDPNGNVVQEFEPSVESKLDVNQTYLDAIMQGMKSVISPEDGAGMNTFQGWKYADIIGGKTGTGVVTQNVPVEDNSWFVSFAPYDDPEIVVVIYIPNGYKGAYSSMAAKDILEYYLDRKYADDSIIVPDADSIVTTPDDSEVPAEGDDSQEGQDNPEDTGDGEQDNG